MNGSPMRCAITGFEIRDSGEGIWDDGEWISWDEINEQIQYKEWRARYPDADLTVVSVLESLNNTAQHYHELTGFGAAASSVLNAARRGETLIMESLRATTWC